MIRLLMIAAAAVSFSASAQMTTITASSLKMGGSPITVGTVTITAVNTSGAAIVYADGTGAQNGPTPYVCNVSNGAITTMVHPDGTSSGLCTIPDSSDTIPANILYSFTLRNTSTGLSTSGQSYAVNNVVGVSGASWALDHYAPQAATNAASAMTSQVVETLPETCAGSALYTYTGDLAGPSLYSCIGGVPVLVSSTVMTGYATGITTLTGDITATGTGTAVATLPNVNNNPGTFGSANSVPVLTIDSKGRITGIGIAPITGGSGSSGTLTDSGTSKTYTLQIQDGNLVAVPVS